MSTILEQFKAMGENAPKHVDIYVEKSMDILDRIHDLMEEEDINQRQLAERLGKKETEVSRWINGVQNFTLKTLCRLEEALGQDIIKVPKKRHVIARFISSGGTATKMKQSKPTVKARETNEVDTMELMAA